MNFQAHPNVPHVGYTSTQNHGVLMLHFVCQICGDQTSVRCSGYRGMPQFRLNEYANQHRHKLYPVIANPRPR